VRQFVPAVRGINGGRLNLLFTALLMLCGLGSASFATTASGKRETIAALALAIVIAAARIPADALPDARWIGCVVAAVAAIQIFRTDVRWIGPLCGGALAGLLGALVQIQGLPFAIGVLLAAAVPSVSAYLSGRRPKFAPEALREEAMLAIVALGLAVAVIPGINAGWQSALALNRDAGISSSQTIANWVLVLSAASVVLGGLYSLLRRR
jgi:hypothetical protein